MPDCPYCYLPQADRDALESHVNTAHPLKSGKRRMERGTGLIPEHRRVRFVPANPERSREDDDGRS